MAEVNSDDLKLFWNFFFKAETGTYEKSTWLELFLAEFLIRLNDGANPKELITFCPISGVASLVGCELLCGIHRVTSSIKSHYPVPLEASTGSEEKKSNDEGKPSGLFSRANAQSSEEILAKYLLGGVAWRCLVLLKTLGVEGVSCCRQLSSVLIWLGELSGGLTVYNQSRSDIKIPTVQAKQEIYDLFSIRVWTKQRFSGQPSFRNETTALNNRGTNTNKSRQIKNETPKRKPEHSSESVDSDADLQVLNRSLTIKISTPDNDFEYFTSPSRDRHDECFHEDYASPKKTKPKADDYTTEKHRAIINSEISLFQFTLITTELLQELCKTESSFSGSEGSQISFQCINFALRNLSYLEFGSLPVNTQQYTPEQISQLKVSLTELLIVSLDKVLLRTDLCAKLIQNGILPKLLRLLEDIVCKSNKKYTETPITEVIDKSISENFLKYVFGLAFSITAFFHCLLMQCRSVDKLREFADQFRLYSECLQGLLFKECIELMIRLPGKQDTALILIRKLIEAIGRLICGMKRVRSEVIHSAACPKNRHKVCRARVTAGMHHHHDILGDSKHNLSHNTCCISVLYATLTSLLIDDEIASQSALRNKILRVMLNSGVCCCFSTGYLMENVVRLMLTQSNCASRCLCLLEHTVYGELGASVLAPKVTDQLPCAICEPSEGHNDIVRTFYTTAIEKKDVWSFLIHYNSLLQSDNSSSVLHTTVAHLLRVTPKCRMDMKYELLFSVVYPTFIVAKHRYMIRLEESAYFLTVSCLNIFASLLNTVSFAEQFILKGGLSYVLELVSLSEFSKQCCSILEIAIVVEIFKLTRDNNTEMNFKRDLNTLASVQMLIKSLADMNDKCLKIYQIKLTEDVYNKLTDLKTERETFFIEDKDKGSPRKVSPPQNINTTFAMSENSKEDTIDNYIEVLRNVYTFWKTCANLCLYSPMYREHLVKENVFIESYGLLKLLLHYLFLCECGAAESRIVIKIVEALLTVQFAVSDVTSGRSKLVSCDVIRAGVICDDREESAGEQGTQNGGESVLRPLCEALIRVATAAPSDHHTMPPINDLKSPQLVDCEANSSPERSSSEESVPGVYESEHSGNNTDHNGNTDGYEADIEVSKLDQQLAYKSRKSSVMNGGKSSVLETYSYDSGFECGEYVRTGAVVHPELCIIVVDILSQLIQKLASIGECSAVSMSNASRVCRACCGRLGAALSARCVPPPGLLDRLLTAAGPALLTRNQTHLQELQSSVLDLIHVIATQSIQPSELEALLKLFRTSKQVPHALLGALARLANSCTPFTPQAILSFPLRRMNSNDDMISLSDEMKHISLNTTTSQSHQAEVLARNLCEQHTKNGISSCWRYCGARCGVEGAGWAPWVHGLAAALWVRPHHLTHTDTSDDWNECSEETDNEVKSSPNRNGQSRPTALAHVFSIGYDSLMFEIWMDAATGALTLRLTRPDPNCDQVLSTAQVETRLPHHSWTCLGFNVKELLHKRKIYLQVTIFMNGYEAETISLPFSGIMVRKLGPVCVLLGSRGGGAYHVASLSVLRAPVLTAPAALHLAAIGPDAPPLITQVETLSPNYPLIMTRDIIESNIDWDQVYGMSNHIIRELQDKLLLTFSAHSPAIMNLYHPTAALPTVFPPLVSAPSPPMSSIPETLYVWWAATPAPSRHHGLAPALHMLGGGDLLIFLLARVVELEGTPEQQAMALSILLRVCRVDNQLFSMFYNDQTLNMLHTVFASPKCKLSLHSLKVLLDVACSAPIISLGFVVNCRTDAFVVEPKLLVTIVRAWRQLDAVKDCAWEEDMGGTSRSRRGSLWTCGLAAIRALLHDRHPARHHNHYHLNHSNLLEHLLRACKERFLNGADSDYGCLEPDASSHFVEIVRGLIGTPPLLHHLALLADFLILMHQASDTFVTHSRANFYFLLTPETQEASDFNYISFLKKRRSERRINRSQSNNESTTTRSTTPSLKSEDFSENTVKEQEKYDDYEDNEKQVKGMMNIQIKEKRKYNLSSSISDNSDASDGGNFEKIVVESRSGDGALSEYVVVDVGDVTTTTVEMCESGIYHQRVVRSGATPGWAACEGLMLLLRDAINVLPEHALSQVVGVVIQPESLVVLGNHREPSVRAALVRVVSALQRRAPAALAKLTQYYMHLANQISLYPGSWELATACVALLTKCDVPLEDQLDEEIWVDVSSECGVRAPPLLAVLLALLVLPGLDVALAHNLTRVLANLIHKTSLKVLSEIGIAEVVTKCIGAVGDLELEEGKDLLLDDLNQLLIKLVIKALSSQHHMQTVHEIHYMLLFVESTCNGGGGIAAREAQCALYRAQIQYLDQKLHHNYSKQHYFSTVLGGGVGGVGGEPGREGAGRVRGAVRGAVRRAVGGVCAVCLPTPPDLRLAELLLNTLLHGCNTSGARRAWWLGGESSEWAPLLLDLSWWMLSSDDVELAAMFLRITYHHQHQFTLDHNSQRKMAVYLLCALQRIHLAVESGRAPLELAITDWARGWAVQLQGGLADRVHPDTLHEEAARHRRHDTDRWLRQAAQHAPHLLKAVWSKEALASKVTESAMAMTRKVVDVQNNERKTFMEHLRRAHSETVASTQRWNRLIETYTHEQALWHDPESYPQSWQLDSTEGIGRIRVRLRRTHLHIDPRYFKPTHKHKAVSPVCVGTPGPLRSVVGACGGSSGVQRGLVARLQLNETVGHMARVTHVTVDADTRGELLLSDRSIHFVPEDADDDDKESSTGSNLLKKKEKIVRTCSGCETHSTGALSWPLEIVREVVTRRWCLQERAVELMLSTGHAQLLAFSDSTERAAFLHELANLLPIKPEPDNLTEAMNLWRQGAITNWEYLMRLNGLAGRTYNDLMQYPILPFVIADYTSKILNLTDPASFRNLAKPMAIQNKNREQHYINTYNDLRAARRDGSGSLLSRQPHHYASLYSNSGAILHYLVRVPPFTQLLLNYQDNNFDMPDRTFHSLATTWRLITNDSASDVKEMIPELYYLPEMFSNNEGLNLGVRQCGVPVEGVELPPWAADGRLFTLIQRQALEAPHVTEMLPHWIDLVFGYKQTGQHAIDAINVFPACTYYGFDPGALEDEVDRVAAEAMVRTYGQAPRQLLRGPHPHRHTDLHTDTHRQREVVSGVVGARWGSYCGSVSAGPPLEVQRRVVPSVRRLLPLAHSRSVALLAHNQTLISLYGTNTNSLTSSGTSATSNSTSTLALVSWGHSDGVVRLKRRRDSRPDLLLHIPPHDQITCVSSSVSVVWSPVVVGLRSGRVWVCGMGAGAGPGAGPGAGVCPLVGHRAPLAAVHVSTPTLLTASQDGTVILWDLHRLTYIRTLPNRDMLPVTHATISDTLCDVATVHDLSSKAATNRTTRLPTDLEMDSDSYEKDTENYQSLIRVHTVNGSYVGSVKVVDKVTCICYSNAPEGISVNCIAAGLDSGGIMLYSSWDLRPTTFIPLPANMPRLPLISICYSSDSSLLFGCYEDGCFVSWENGGGGVKPAPIRILTAQAMF